MARYNFAVAINDAHKGSCKVYARELSAGVDAEVQSANRRGVIISLSHLIISANYSWNIRRARPPAPSLPNEYVYTRELP